MNERLLQLAAAAMPWGHALLCLGIFVTGFCRIRKMNDDTMGEVRFSVVLLTVVFSAAGVAPFIPDWSSPVTVPQMLTTGSVLLVQVVSGRLWRFGVPRSFQKSDF